MHTSKYDPLRRRLESAPGREVAMTFGEVEGVLGFRLPPSARAHRVWWSNNPGTNVAVRAWREAGRKTARVDMASEKVVFVRDEEQAARRSATTPMGADPNLVLSPLAEAMIEKEVALTNGDRASVMAAILHGEAVARRKRALAALRDSLPKIDVSLDELVEWIREDRDSH